MEAFSLIYDFLSTKLLLWLAVPTSRKMNLVINLLCAQCHSRGYEIMTFLFFFTEAHCKSPVNLFRRELIAFLVIEPCYYFGLNDFNNWLCLISRQNLLFWIYFVSKFLPHSFFHFIFLVFYYLKCF